MSEDARDRTIDGELARIAEMSETERNELRDKLLDRLDLAEMIEAEGIALRRDGRDLRGLCPFHEDRSPSLTVYAKGGRQRFKCFSCDVCGDAIDWSCLRSGKTYHETLADLAGRTGTDAGPPATKRRPRERPAPREFATPREAADELRRIHRSEGATETAYRYLGPAGEVLGGCLRFDRPGARKTMRYLWRAPSGSWRIEGFEDLPAHPLYNVPGLLASDASEPVFVFEGEKKAEAGRECGLVSTSSPHGARSAKRADWSPLRDRAVVVVPDRDEPGECYAREVSELVKAAGASSVRVVELWSRWPDLPAGGDLADLAEGRGPDELAQLGETLRELAAEAMIETGRRGALPCYPVRPVQASPDEGEVAEVCTAPRIDEAATADELDLPEAFRPFPVHAMPEPLASFVREASEAVGCDPSMVALPLLSAIAGAIGNSLQAEVSPDWREPSILWTAVVCDPGDRKTQAMRQALGPIRRHEGHLRADHEAAMAEHREATAEHSRNVERWKTEGKTGDRPEEPAEPPAAERIIATDSTIEALARMLAKNPRGLLLVQNELGQWFADFNRYASSGRGGDAFKWAECFDAEAWTIDRVTSGSVFVPRVSVSVAGAIQPGTLRAALSDRGGQHRDNGLAARFNIAAPPRRRPASAFEVRTVRQATRAKLGRVFEALLALPVPRCELGHPSPQAVRFDRTGLAALKRWHPRIEAAMAEREGHLRAVWSKLGGGLVRYALVLQCARWAAALPSVGMPMRSEIDGEAVDAAAELVQWFGREWDRFDEATESEADEPAAAPRRQTDEERRQRQRRKLLRHVIACGGELTPRQLANRDRALRPVSRALAELRALAADGLGRIVTRENPGAPASVVFVLSTADRETETAGGGGEDSAPTNCRFVGARPPLTLWNPSS